MVVKKEWAVESDSLSLDPSSTLQKLLKDSKPQFPHLENEDNNKDVWHIQIKIEKFIQLSDSGWFDLCRQNI